ncbi:glycosyltransferase family 4 protein [Robertmurraya massiliosenegalensis]|uniref:glycosyltransferase family 4 protein n=1 Tax=Robertmurraya massiliosenegalensis TaxID=1287657 RepID=UPI0002F760EA|nr:glycosyltransferase family 4 protein [Robertmurraya massiliosenegalensis]
MKLKVCFLVTEHSFLDVRIFEKEAKSLQKKGYEVTLIVPKVNGYLFDINGKKVKDLPSSKSFYHDGIKIIPYSERLAYPLIYSYYDQITSRHHNGFQDELTRLGVEENADIYHAHEFLSFYAGVGIKRTLQENGRKVKLIYDSHELFPDPLESMNQRMRMVMEDMLKKMLKEVDGIITVSESIKSWYLRKKPDLFIEIIYNSPPLAREYREKELTSPFTIIHEGFISETRGNWRKMIGMVEALQKEMDIRFKIIGGKRANEKKLVVPPHLKNHFEIKEWMNFSEIPQEMKSAHLGWIDLKLTHSLNNQYAMPNKFFSYLNNGVPVLVNNALEMKTFIEKHQCGIVVPKDQATPEDYVHAIRNLTQNKELVKKMSANARRVMEESYCWEKMEQKLIDFYNRIMTKI